MDTVDGVELDSFASGSSVRRLGETNCRDVPTAAGVYVVIRPAAGVPRFMRTSGAGRFKGLDPSYPAQTVSDVWVPGATLVYIGKAAGARGLRQRLSELVRFAYGANVGHRGGRLLWHLPDWEELLVRWQVCPRQSADARKPPSSSASVRRTTADAITPTGGTVTRPD
ncbi:hypothetical protein [Burkholderia pseudomallei]|uniref:hypothetical protein n=1 Tax=Burkholderia pseudomallei TaxID=28450 RepID=UPI0021F6CF55|nr:hypothetical protein [Burkholderia pseudomallei]MCW0131868.1 hypothetical protein [Burkholderia pseudomallei]